MYKKILVPVSMKHSGDRTHKALAHAMGICDGEIVLLHITNPVPSLVGGAARKELVDEETSAGRAALAPLLEKLDEAGIRHHTRIDFGIVATVIVKVAHEEKVDLIVMFTDGRDGLEDMLFGSITERVLRETDIPLLVVRR